MPTQARTTRQQAWIEAMLTGVTPTEAARIAKYAAGTEKQRGHENVTNSDLMAEISLKRAESAAKVEFTVQTAQSNNSRIMAAAELAGQFSAAVSANVANARLYGMDKQTTVTEHTPDQPIGAEAEALEQAARQYKIKLAGTG